ncbi:hypothetical protein ACIPYR_32795 [Streptomyces parvus]
MLVERVEDGDPDVWEDERDGHHPLRRIVALPFQELDHLKHLAMK